MKKLLTSLLFFCCLNIFGSIVYFPLTNWNGTTATNRVKVTPVGDTALVDGQYFVVGPAKWLSPTNGICTNTMNGGNFRMDIDGLSYPLPIFFAVPSNDTNTYNVTNLWISGGSFFNYSPGVRQIIGTNGFVVSPANGMGSVTLDGSTFVPQLFIAAGTNATVVTNGNLRTISSTGGGGANVAAGTNIVAKTNGAVTTISLASGITNYGRLTLDQSPWSGSFVSMDGTNGGLNIYGSDGIKGDVNAGRYFASNRGVTGGHGLLSGGFIGDGEDLTNLYAGEIRGGTLADARLSANVPLLNAQNAWSASNNIPGAFIGNGGGLTNLPVGTAAYSNAASFLLSTNPTVYTSPGGTVNFKKAATGGTTLSVDGDSGTLTGRLSLWNIQGSDGTFAFAAGAIQGTVPGLIAQNFFGPIYGASNASPNLATNADVATDGQALVKSGDRLKLVTISGIGDVVQAGQNNFIGSNTMAGPLSILGSGSSGTFVLKGDGNSNVLLTNVAVGASFTFSEAGLLTANGGFSGPASLLTGLNASSLGSGTVPTARLGSGTANNTTVLFGDSVWRTIGGGDVFLAGNNPFTGSNNFAGLTRYSNNVSIDAAHKLSLSNLTVNALMLPGTDKGIVSLANGGANTLLHGTTPPAYSAVVEGDLSLSDVTTANVSTSAHGFVSKLPNDATKYFDGTGVFSVPPGSGGAGTDNTAWHTNGDNPPAGSFLGTTGSKGLWFKVNNNQVGLIDAKSNYTFSSAASLITTNSSSQFNGIWGGNQNSITNGVNNGIVGGQINIIGSGSVSSAIIGGSNNKISNGGSGANSTVIVGGSGNDATNAITSMMAGANNLISGNGLSDLFIFGQNAKGQHNNVFVFSDSQATSGNRFASVADDSFNVQAQGGIVLRGAMVVPTLTKTTNYTFTAKDEGLYVNSAGGGLTMTLPASPMDGETHWIKKISSDANTASLEGNGHNIDGLTSRNTSVQYTSFRVRYNLSTLEWFMIP